MDELRESSLLFSLESLLETERERVEREAREAKKRREDELRRVAELAERRRVAAQQEREARARRGALEQERERLERERLEAMKRATVERARIEAEAQMRLVEVEQQRKHELSLAKLREGESTAHYRTLSWLVTGLLGALIAATALGYFGLVQPVHARQREQLQSLVDAADRKRAESERQLSAARAEQRELAEQVSKLEAQLAKPAPAATLATTKGPTRRGSSAAAAPASSPAAPREVCKDDGDPLNHALCVTRRR